MKFLTLIILIILLLSALLATAQPPACPCNLTYLKSNKPTKSIKLPTFKYGRNTMSLKAQRLEITKTVNSTRKTIDHLDTLIKNHFDNQIKEQLRGLADNYEDRKYLKADIHGKFLCKLDSLTALLEANKVHFDSTHLVSSISSIFQAYLNSLNMYHDQSRNLVNWYTLTQRSDQYRKPVRYVSIHEGSINIYNQSYNFVELCKNNLLKEFSILELAYVADSLKQDSKNIIKQMGILKSDLEQKNQALQDRLTKLGIKLDSVQRDPLVQAIRNARQTKKHRRIIIKLN
ncbi:hypothetical protein [Spirosoma flavum]|uniref:Uncharacterized protein n=1 Tax=Spirosoma flavum TaxID=2048557 RepID=A0ABW6AKD0_9BACT